MKIPPVLKKIGEYKWLIALAIIAFACVVQPDILATALAGFILILLLLSVLVIFPGCLLIPVIPFWLYNRSQRKRVKELEQRLKELEK